MFDMIRTMWERITSEEETEEEYYTRLEQMWREEEYNGYE